MRKDLDTLPEEIKEHGFDFHWDNEKVWALDIPVEEVDVKEIDWVLDLPFWQREGKKYNLSLKEVLENIEAYSDHKDRIMKADISHPIDLMKNQNDRWLILDGMHRLARLIMEGKQKVKVRKISRKIIPLIEK